jgi:hypothetical protein
MAPVDADHAYGCGLAFDQESGVAGLIRRGTDERDRVFLEVGMRQPAQVDGNAMIVGKARNRFYVRERRPAQHQPLGLEDEGSRFMQCGRRCRDVLQHVGLLA